MDKALAALAGVDAHGLSVPELKELSSRVGRVKSKADSLLLGIAAEIAASGTSASAEQVLQQTTRMSKREARRRARTAETLGQMPNVAERLDEGKITFEHAAALADTARQTGAEAVDRNTELLERAGMTPADLFAAEARCFANRQAEDRGESRYRRQRAKRSLSMFTADDGSGMGRLSGWLDPVSFGLVREAIDSRAARLRRQDCSTAAGSDHNRSGPQRRADALVELTTERDGLTLAAIDKPCTASGNSSASGGAGRNDQARPETHLVIVADIGLIDGTDPSGRCEIPGSGPVPPSILAQLSPDAKIAGLVFGGNGQPLWLGRASRHTNAHQRLAIAVRDRGCALCGAPMHQCEIHHKQPWKQGGGTDIDNLQALCREHHRQQHGPHSHADGYAAKNRPPNPPPSGPSDAGPPQAAAEHRGLQLALTRTRDDP